jgi:hypothetical protein
MRSHGIEMVGKFIMHPVPTLPAWTSNDVARLIFVEDENMPYYGGTVAWGDWIPMGQHFIDLGTATDPANGLPFTGREYIMEIVNGNINLVYNI